MTAQETLRESRLRRVAQRHGLKLIKSRRRDTRAVDFGRYWLVDEHTHLLVTDELGVGLEEIELYLTSDER